MLAGACSRQLPNTLNDSLAVDPNPGLASIFDVEGGLQAYGSVAATGGPRDQLGAASIYAIFPEIFSAAGNLQAITLDLPRLAGLGFKVIYLMPIAPIGKATAHHPSVGSPYAVSDFLAIRPSYGDGNDLRALIAAAHGVGMQVWLDEVLNHSAWDHPFIRSHPEYYVHTDDNPGNVDSIAMAFSYSDVAQFDLKRAGNGVGLMLSEMLVRWLHDYDIDGFRFDSASNPDNDQRMIPAYYWQALAQRLETARPGVVLFGEEANPDLALAPFHLDYGWDMHQALLKACTGGGAAGLRATWETRKRRFPAQMLHANLLQNWDMPLDLVQYGGADPTLAAALLTFTLDGVPMVFAGEEIGNDQSGHNTHLKINWESPLRARFSAFYADALALRNGHPALQQGPLGWLDNSAPSQLVTFQRLDANHQIVVAINFSAATVAADVAGLAHLPGSGWQEITPSGAPGGAAHAGWPSLTLAPWDFAVFRRPRSP